MKRLHACKWTAICYAVSTWNKLALYSIGSSSDRFRCNIRGTFHIFRVFVFNFLGMAEFLAVSLYRKVQRELRVNDTALQA